MGHIGSWEWDMQTGDVCWSAEMYSLYGLDPSSFVPDIRSVGKYVHPDDRGMIDEVIQRAATTGRPVEFEFRIVRTDGSTRILNTRCEITAWDEYGKARLMLGTNQDVTERKRVENSYIASTKLWRIASPGERRRPSSAPCNCGNLLLS